MSIASAWNRARRVAPDAFPYLGVGTFRTYGGKVMYRAAAGETYGSHYFRGEGETLEDALNDLTHNMLVYDWPRGTRNLQAKKE